MFGLRLAEGAELRPLEPWSAGEFAAHVDRVRGDLLPWIPFAKTVVDEESARAYLQGYAERQAAGGGRIFGIWIDGELSGGTLFREFDAEAGVCEVGVWMGAAGRGRALVTRAVRHMIDWAVRTRGIARVEWRCDPDNERSMAAARRLGFTLEATLRSAYVLDGRRRDVQVWALLAEEWPA